MPSIAESLTAVAALPGVPEATAAARDACTRLRWHEALRRRIPQAAAESRVRGARASAALDGAQMSLDVVRDLMRGATAWPPEPDPLEQVLRGVVQATAETEHLTSLVVTAAGAGPGAPAHGRGGGAAAPGPGGTAAPRR